MLNSFAAGPHPDAGCRRLGKLDHGTEKSQTEFEPRKNWLHSLLTVKKFGGIVRFSIGWMGENRAGMRTYDQPGGIFFSRRRWTDEGIRMDSRYLATVRRAITIPSRFSSSTSRTFPPCPVFPSADHLPHTPCFP